MNKRYFAFIVLVFSINICLAQIMPLTLKINTQTSDGIFLISGKDTLNDVGNIEFAAKKIKLKILFPVKMDSVVVLLDNTRYVAVKTNTTIPFEIDSVKDTDLNLVIYLKSEPVKTYQVTASVAKATTLIPKGPVKGPNANALAELNFDKRNFYYDAIYIKNAMKDLKSADTLKLKYIFAYYAGFETYPKDSALAEKYSKNPYLKEHIKKIIVADPNGADRTKNVNEGSLISSVSSGISSIGGLNVANYADGMAKFLVKRTKEEMGVAFFDRLKTFLAKEEYEDARLLFPASYGNITAIGDEIYMYDAYMQTLKEGFEKDFHDMPDNFPKVIDNHPELDEAAPDVAVSLKSACYVTASLRDKEHIGNILSEYPSEYLEEIKTKNFKSSIQLVQLISESLKDTATAEDSPYWISYDKFNALAKNKEAFYIYLGLIRQASTLAPYNEIYFETKGATISFKSILDSVYSSKIKSNIKEYTAYVKDFIQKTERLSRQIKSYEKATSDSLRIEQYYTYFNSSMDVVEHSAKFNKLPYLKDYRVSDTIKDCITMTRCAGNIVAEVNRKKYSSALINAVQIYGLISKDFIRKRTQQLNSDILLQEAIIARVKAKPKEERILKANKDIVTAAKSKIEENESELKKAASLTKFKTDLLKYGTFMATVAKAENSDEIADAIEAFALPPGSARIKRVSHYNVSLNAYVGPYFGSENIQKLDGTKPQFNSYGLTAPIGFASSWGFGNKYRSSFSLFVSVIDIGALTAFRFQNDTVAQLPNLELKNIISPGVFLSYGIPKCPLSVNLGAQMGPNLRKVSYSTTANATTYDYSNSVYWRFSASICMDIPLLNLYTSSRKYNTKAAKK